MRLHHVGKSVRTPGRMSTRLNDETQDELSNSRTAARPTWVISEPSKLPRCMSVDFLRKARQPRMGVLSSLTTWYYQAQY